MSRAFWKPHEHASRLQVAVGSFWRTGIICENVLVLLVGLIFAFCRPLCLVLNQPIMLLTLTHLQCPPNLCLRVRRIKPTCMEARLFFWKLFRASLTSHCLFKCRATGLKWLRAQSLFQQSSASNSNSSSFCGAWSLRYASEI